jgi:dimethylhistidine N-methyltransferase
MPRTDTLTRTAADHAQFAHDVSYYLSQTPRQLPSRYLYDELGSALFEAICRLPWYAITRIEQAMLAEHADAIFRRLPGVSTAIELGSGSGEKLATLLDRRAHRPMVAHLVDVSEDALLTAQRVLARFPQLTVVPHRATYEEGLADAVANRSAGQALVLFLGSNLGNFDPPNGDAFLRTVRSLLREGDALLIGADLVKSERDLLLAYDDPLGVTAAFNKNLLVRANRELGADFDIAGFAHRALWNREESRVEMHLVSVRRHRVRVPASSLEIDFEAGETIWTESSYKYEPAGLRALLGRTGFEPLDQLSRSGFALTLARAQ